MSKLLRAQYTYCLVVLLMSTHSSISKILATFDVFSYFHYEKDSQKWFSKVITNVPLSTYLFEWLFLKMIFCNLGLPEKTKKIFFINSIKNKL